MRDYKEYKHSELPEKVIGGAHDARLALWHGFLESVYENAMTNEFEHRAILFERQKRIPVYSRDEIVSDFAADMIDDEKANAELKACKTLNEAREAQLVKYLKATGCEAGFSANLGGRLEIKRRIFDRGNEAEYSASRK